MVHYVIVRSDAPHGLQAAMLIHAAGESSPGGLPEGTIAVALGVPDQAELLAVAERLRAHGIDHHVVVENEGPYAGQTMAIGVVPTTDRKRVRRALSDLPLVS